MQNRIPVYLPERKAKETVVLKVHSYEAKRRTACNGAGSILLSCVFFRRGPVRAGAAGSAHGAWPAGLLFE
ncbi:exported hypothetical protein [Verrucomicrobia bacterium]|nr:exported hypothetical protein [Verrucomicrobiota bacterium]